MNISYHFMSCHVMLYHMKLCQFCVQLMLCSMFWFRVCRLFLFDFACVFLPLKTFASRADKRKAQSTKQSKHKTKQQQKQRNTWNKSPMRRGNKEPLSEESWTHRSSDQESNPNRLFRLWIYGKLNGLRWFTVWRVARHMASLFVVWKSWGELPCTSHTSC